MALSNCVATLKSNNEISSWLADDIDQALANRGRVSKKKALASYIETAMADMKAELEDIYDDLGIDAKDPLLGYVAPVAEKVDGGETAQFSNFRSVDTSSPEFKRWFGESVVTDADGNPDIRYSEARASEWLPHTFRILSELDGAHQTMRIPDQVKSINAIAALVDASIESEHISTKTVGDRTITTITLNGRESKIIREGNMVHIDVGQQGRGLRGNRIYSIAGAYAHNNGLTFRPDPSGFLPDGMVRRLEHMISLVLKYKSSDWILPDQERQMKKGALGLDKWPGFKWVEGDTGKNLQSMLEASMLWVQANYPEIKNVKFDPDTLTFYREVPAAAGGGGSTREDISGAAWRRMAADEGARAADAGVSTLKRAVLTESILSDARQGRRILDRLLLQRMERATTPEDLRDILYSEQRGAVSEDAVESPARSQLTGQQIQNTWASPDIDGRDDFKRKISDKMIDTKAVVDAIKAAGRQIKDQFDPYLQEILYHGRAAKQVTDFKTNELRPLFEEMAKYKIEKDELGTYLWAMHAPERNAQIAKVNANMPDGGSGLTNQQAADILAGQTVVIKGKDYKINRNKMMAYRSLGAKVKSINRGTTDLLVAAGLETQETVDAWRAAYSDYVPLMRDMEADDNFMGAFNLGMGTGQGFSVKGSSSKRAMGSEREVIDILANVAMQRERAITRAEKNRVAMAVYGMALQNPNTDFWLTINPDAKDPAKIAGVIQELIAMGVNPIDAQNIANEPKQTYVDPNTGMVASRINPQLRGRADVLSVRINGKDRYVMFSSDERAQQMVTGLKNLDAEQLGIVMQKVAFATRYFSSINTQYNPVFGLTNIIRDSSTAMLNLSSTPLAGKQADVAKHVMSALKGIYSDLRDHRAGKAPTSVWANEFEEFQRYGGQTGYRDMFQTSKQRAEDLESEIRKAGKGEAAWKVFSEDHPVGGWLSDYNTTLENAWRLAAYKTAKENGMSKERAAALAKGLTVNFNKKGTAATQMGAMYAFFNAAVQGTARIVETMVKDGKLTPAGKKIMIGGMTVGVMQAVMFAMAGWDDEEPPQFIREKNFIIPLPSGKYISIPYPLGFHIIPGFGRIATEFALGGFKDPAKRLVQLTSMFIDGFNPLGSSTLTQTMAPTVVDPIVALAENKDWSGKNIYKEDFSKMKPTAGWTRTKDTATDLSRVLSYGLNYISGGGKYGIGQFSPTPDQIDYLGGQITGGLGREISKGWQTGRTIATGEELPAYKRPVLGRFYGETTGQASEMSKFYNNLTRIGEHASALDEMKDAKDFEARREYLAENPEARLTGMADKAQRELGYLKRQKRDAAEKGEKGRVQMIEARITATVKRWNDKLSPKEK